MRFTFPHPLVLLIAGVVLAAGLTWVLPAGQFERREDPGSGKTVVVAGTYHAVEKKPVGPFAAMVAIPRGLGNAADIVFFVFLVGGAFSVVDETGVLRRVVDVLATRLASRRTLVIPLCCGVFALGGALENMQEEIIPLVPVLLLLCRRLGFDALTAVAMSIGAASVGSAFSPVNPFQAVIGQKLAELPPVSAWEYRVAFALPALGIWTWATWRKAQGGKQRQEAAADDDTGPGAPARRPLPSTPRLAIILCLLGLAFAVFVLGVVRFHWGFEEMGTVFLIMGLAAGLVGGLGVNGTAEALLRGFREMAFAALLIGFARAVFVVLDDGHVVDTLVAGLFAPLGKLPVPLAALGMIGAQTLVHFPVPSVSGQAVLTLPILVPLADLLGMPRQVVVLAFQYGAGLCELVTPTNGALLAILSAAGVPFERWLRFVLPVYALLLALGLAAVWLGVAVGLR